MKKRKLGLVMASLLAVGSLLGACGTKEEGKNTDYNETMKKILSQ